MATRGESLRSGLLLFSVMMLLVSLLGPRWGVERRTAFRTQGRVWLVLDVSRSMLTPDVAPNRLERGKVILERVAQSLPGLPVGLLAVRGGVVLTSPPTTDRDALRTKIEELSIDSAPPSGSRWQGALNWLARHKSGRPQTPEAVVIVSDGGEPSIDAAYLRAAREAGLVAMTIGVGDEKLQQTSDPARHPLRRAALHAAARETGGLYVPAGQHEIDLGAIVAERLMPKMELVETALASDRRIDRGGWFVWPALLAALTATALRGINVDWALKRSTVPVTVDGDAIS
ncbi:vWA domain-containing protein [Planctomycetes bacterium Pan216]